MTKKLLLKIEYNEEYNEFNELNTLKTTWLKYFLIKNVCSKYKSET